RATEVGRSDIRQRSLLQCRCPGWLLIGVVERWRGRTGRYARGRHMGRQVSAPGELRRRIAALPAGPDVDTTLREAARIVRHAVPFDDWIWLTYDPETMLPTAAVDDGQSWQL